jgi:signal peptidase II
VKTSKKRSLVFILIIAALTLLTDQLSKIWVVHNLTSGVPYYPLPFLGDLFAFTYTTNTGVVFGLLRDRSFVMILVVLVIIIAVFTYARYIPINRTLTRLGLGLQLGGALGNQIDRFNYGHVVDFIDLGIGSHRWFTSNVADVCLVTGVIILAVVLLFFEEKPASGKPETTEPAAGSDQS